MHCIWCVVLDFYLICKSNSQDFTVKQNMISHCHILYPVHKRDVYKRQLRGCQVHTSVMLSEVDIKIFKKLGVDLTSEPVRSG